MGKPRAPDPTKLTEASLEQAALRYLDRYASSAAGLRRILLRRVRRNAGDGDGRQAAASAIDAVLRRLVGSGLLDDARYAEVRAASLARRGLSLSAIRRDLGARGVARPEIEAALAAIKGDAGGTDAADLAAALALARRRRLGPFRVEGQRAAFRMRDLAALGRAGFAFEVAKRVVDGEAENG